MSEILIRKKKEEKISIRMSLRDIIAFITSRTDVSMNEMIVQIDIHWNGINVGRLRLSCLLFRGWYFVG